VSTHTLRSQASRHSSCIGLYQHVHQLVQIYQGDGVCWVAHISRISVTIMFAILVGIAIPAKGDLRGVRFSIMVICIAVQQLCWILSACHPSALSLPPPFILILLPTAARNSPPCWYSNLAFIHASGICPARRFRDRCGPLRDL